MTTQPALSVLDLVPVRADQTTADAIQASLSLARTADDHGYTRYWVAEHHNMPAVAATNPPVLIAMIGAATNRIRVGSGGMMLPNHAPFVVAEQFALLEAAYPGRVDLGIGRAPGSDQVTNWVLRNGGSNVPEDLIAQFPRYVEEVIAMMSQEGTTLQLRGEQYPLRATPSAASEPEVWLLGSSDYSATLAADLGLPYVFAHHFSGDGTAEALELYRSRFKASDLLHKPRTFLTLNAVVADTAEEAEELARPQLLGMVALRTTGRINAQLTVEDAAKREVPPAHQGIFDGMHDRWVIGDAEFARTKIAELAERYEVDEVMISPAAAAYAGADPQRNVGRETTLRLLDPRQSKE